jgi:hypothetical protein
VHSGNVREKGSVAVKPGPRSGLTRTVPEPSPVSVRPDSRKDSSVSGAAVKSKVRPQTTLCCATVSKRQLVGRSTTGANRPHVIALASAARQ